jgi:hypothetical protein
MKREEESTRSNRVDSAKRCRDCGMRRRPSYRVKATLGDYYLCERHWKRWAQMAPAPSDLKWERYAKPVGAESHWSPSARPAAPASTEQRGAASIWPWVKQAYLARARSGESDDAAIARESVNSSRYLVDSDEPTFPPSCREQPCPRRGHGRPVQDRSAHLPKRHPSNHRPDDAGSILAVPSHRPSSPRDGVG